MIILSVVGQIVCGAKFEFASYPSLLINVFIHYEEHPHVSKSNSKIETGTLLEKSVTSPSSGSDPLMRIVV